MTHNFGYVYVDTNVLRKARWPNESTELEVFLFLAQILGVTVVVCNGSDIERRRQWVEELQNDIREWTKLNNTLKKLGILIDRAGLFGTELKQIYDDTAERVKQRWNIQTIPLAVRHSDHLFDLAVHKKAAFEQSGKGFQDTLIYLSAIDHLKTVQPARGAFVSEDKVFHSPAIEELTKTEGVEIQIFQSIEKVIEHFRNCLADDPKRLWQLDIRTAEQSLRKCATEIEEFVSQRMKSRADEFVEPGSRGYISTVKLLNIRNVQTPPLEERAPNQMVRLSFVASVQMKIASASGWTLEPGRIVEVDVQLEANAHWTGRNYDQIEILGELSQQIDTITEELSGFRSIVCHVVSTEPVVRAEGLSELIGRVELRLSGRIPPHGDAVHVDVRVALDTPCSGRINPDGFLDATLTSTNRGLLSKGKMRNMNAIVFEGVLLGHGGAPIEDVWVISGIRADATSKSARGEGDFAQIWAGIEIVTADVFRPRAFIANDHASLALIRLGMAPLSDHVPSLPNRQMFLNGKRCEVYSFIVHFNPEFPGAFKTIRQESGDGTSVADSGTVCYMWGFRGNVNAIPG